MSDDIKRLLSDYISEHRSGGEADPAPFVERLTDPGERRVLAELIEAYLERAPRAGWDPRAFRGSIAERATEGLERSLAGASGAWPLLLPRLRHRARLKRAELVERLADALGAGAQREKVGTYYHEMERGLLPAAGVSGRVLEALGALLGESAAALREAGESPPPAEGEITGLAVAGAPILARTGRPDPDLGEVPAGDRPGGSKGTEGERAREAEPWDEVDELFRGGR